MLKFVTSVVLGLSFVVQKGHSYNVECYTCSTLRNETECRYPERYRMTLTKCDQTALDKTRSLAKEIHPKYDADFAIDLGAMSSLLDLNCLKVVTKVGTQEQIIRGCQLAEHSNTDICHKIEQENDGVNLQLVHCSRCATDRCNSASGYSLNFNLMVVLEAAYFYFAVML